jgi:hypothetical protein
MTTRHIVIGLMQHMRAKDHQQCEIKLGLPGGTLSRMYHRKRALTVRVLDRIQGRSGLSFDQLMAWHRQQDEERTP